jgi:hypothetical protein
MLSSEKIVLCIVTQNLWKTKVKNKQMLTAGRCAAIHLGHPEQIPGGAQK